MIDPVRPVLESSRWRNDHLSPWARCQQLASYNGRVGQGIVHTPEYVEMMKLEQAWYDELTDAERAAAWKRP
jgi:hypothetical protein